MGKSKRSDTSSSESSDDELHHLRKKFKKLEKKLERYNKKQKKARLGAPAPRVPSILSNDENGSDPSDPASLEVPSLNAEILLHDDLVPRWESVLRNGLDQSTKDNLLKKYSGVKNCPFITPPKLNPEIKAAINDITAKRDSKLQVFQAQLGADLGGLGKALLMLLNNQEAEGGADVLLVIEALSDAARLLSNLHYEDSESQRAAKDNKETDAGKLQRSTQEDFEPEWTRSKIPSNSLQLQSTRELPESQASIPTSEGEGEKEEDAIGDEESSPPMEGDFPGSRGFITQTLTAKGLPTSVVEIMLQSLSTNTLKQYNSGLKAWWTFCKSRVVHSYKATIPEVLTFLEDQFKKGASYATMNTTRSALSLILSPSVGNDHRVKWLLKGVYRLRSSKPKYNVTWDPSVVLNHLGKEYSNELLSLEKLTVKLATLLALITAQLVQTLFLIKITNIERTDQGFEIKIPDTIKTSGKGRVQPVLNVPYFESKPEICVAKVLSCYLQKTASHRKGREEDNLFITFKKPFRKASAQSISRWIKGSLERCGVDTNIFTAHSTRHAATSAAGRYGVDVNTILSTAGSIKNKYENLKRALKKKIAQNRQNINKTGGGPSCDSKLLWYEEELFAILQLGIEGLFAEGDSDCFIANNDDTVDIVNESIIDPNENNEEIIIEVAEESNDEADKENQPSATTLICDNTDDSNNEQEQAMPIPKNSSQSVVTPKVSTSSKTP
ncbi:hypothetical protein NQ315_017564, partial [Exocentrus adspersus]